MLFWPLILAILIVIGAGICFSYIVYREEGGNFTLAGPIPFMTGIVCLAMSIPIFTSWDGHASDLSKIRAQQPVIEVYEERRDTLATVLENFNYPIRDGITLNADSPVASVVEQLSEVESKLANVKAEVALARRSIEARRAGPMGGIVTLMGDE